MTSEEKLRKIFDGLHMIGRKCGLPSSLHPHPPEYAVKPDRPDNDTGEYNLFCKTGEETIAEVIVTVDKDRIYVRSDNNAPRPFDGSDQVDKALQAVERLLRSGQAIIDSCRKTKTEPKEIPASPGCVGVDS